jgi:hypothetical protein
MLTQGMRCPANPLSPRKHSDVAFFGHSLDFSLNTGRGDQRGEVSAEVARQYTLLHQLILQASDYLLRVSSNLPFFN